MSIKSNHLILCCPLLLLPSIFPSIRVFSNETVLHLRWPKDWSFSFSLSSSNEYSELISFRMDWLDLLAVQGTLKSLFQYCSSVYLTPLSLFYSFIKDLLLTKHWNSTQLMRSKFRARHSTPQTQPYVSDSICLSYKWEFLMSERYCECIWNSVSYERPRGLNVGLCSWRNKANHPELIISSSWFGWKWEHLLFSMSGLPDWPFGGPLPAPSVSSQPVPARLLQGNHQTGTWDWRGSLFTCCDVLCLCRKEKLMPWAWTEATST